MDPIISRQWHSREEGVQYANVAAITAKLGVSPLVGRLLVLRGYDDVAAADLFLHGKLSDLPDPFILKGMREAVERLVRAVEGGEKILVHGDYDVDGISATALLVEFISDVGGEVGYHIPLRLKDGYGLSADAIGKAAGQGVQVVVSVDCGVTAVEEARMAADYGIDLVITDHHQPPEEMPQALAIVNPHQSDCPFPDKNLAGVGVAFFLAIAVRKALRDKGYFTENRPEPDLRHMLDLVALGTIADVVPLTGVNRLLTRVGLQVLTGGDRIGVKALLQVAGIKEVDAGAVGFKLGPRLNAAGRIEDAALGVKLLLSEEKDESAEIAALLDGFNRDRQNIEAKTLRRAEKAVAELEESRRSIVLADADWHPGVIGIVASRLVERYYRPTFLLAIENGQARGSGRSTRDVHLYETLKECESCLKGYGGHAAAAGLSIASESIDTFAECFEKVITECQPQMERPYIDFDGEVLLEELSVNCLNEMTLLAPFGMGNPAPNFMLRGVQIMGLKTVGERHLKFTARQDGRSLPCIAFGMAERQDELEGDIDLLFVPELNHWNGRTEVQLRVRDFRRSVKSNE